jgi:hypothetical protein
MKLYASRHLETIPKKEALQYFQKKFAKINKPATHTVCASYRLFLSLGREKVFSAFYPFCRNNIVVFSASDRLLDQGPHSECGSGSKRCKIS